VALANDREGDDAPLGPLPKPDDQHSLTALRYMVDHFGTNAGVGASGIDFFAAAGIAAAADRRDFALLASLQSGLEMLAAISRPLGQDETLPLLLDQQEVRRRGAVDVRYVPRSK
jgi:hypothetical protein